MGQKKFGVAQNSSQRIIDLMAEDGRKIRWKFFPRHADDRIGLLRPAHSPKQNGNGRGRKISDASDKFNVASRYPPADFFTFFRRREQRDGREFREPQQRFFERGAAEHSIIEQNYARDATS